MVTAMQPAPKPLSILTTLMPERREELLAVAPKTLISGTVVGLNTGAVVALVSLI